MDRHTVDLHWSHSRFEIQEVKSSIGLRKDGESMKTVILIAVIVLADAAGDVLITRGMKQVGEVSTINPRVLLSIAHKVLMNKSFLSGILFFAVTFFSFLTVLSWADLSLVFPATSLVYVVSTLGAKFILKETVTFQRWAGILLVCLGVALVSLP
jgi:transporter family protein